MKQTLLTVWLSGVMIGVGVGVILARSLPSRDAASAQASVNALEVPYQPGTSTLFDPRQAMPVPFQEGGVPSREIEAQKSSTLTEPRLLPEVDASPVTQRSAQGETEKPVENVNASTPKAVLAEDSVAAEFRLELEKIAPGFSLEALDELERIREMVETTPAKSLSDVESSAEKSDAKPEVKTAEGKSVEQAVSEQEAPLLQPENSESSAEELEKSAEESVETP